MTFEIVKTENSEPSETRAYGIDALKILSMFMVVILHLMGHGGMLYNQTPDTLNYYASWFLEMLAFGAVNMFAIVSGYLMINKKFRFSRILRMWLQVAFYSFAISLIFMLRFPSDFDIKALITSLFPVIFKKYWYFSVYFAVCFLSPFINKLLSCLSKREYTVLVVILITLFSVMNMLCDPFSLTNGYGTLWLSTMYIVGGYINKYGKEIKITKAWLFVIYVSCAVFAVFSKEFLEYVSSKITLDYIKPDILIYYTSPTVFLSSASLVLLFSRLEVPESFGRILAFVSPLSFAVYLIHDHPLFRKYVMIDALAGFAHRNIILLLGVVAVSAVCIYSLCTLMEYVRVKVFKLVKIDFYIDRLGRYLDSKIHFI